MSTNKSASNEEQKGLMNRRELLTKYGPYTAPLVSSMLTPSEAYGHKNGQVYSTLTKCTSDTAASEMGARHAPGRPHCGGGGANAHTITNP